jgi:hypothetical protein
MNEPLISRFARPMVEAPEENCSALMLGQMMLMGPAVVLGLDVTPLPPLIYVLSLMDSVDSR